MSNEIRVEYESFPQLAKMISNQSKSIDEVFYLNQKLVQQLEGGGWTGTGAQAFFGEMYDEIFPSMSRLFTALEEIESTLVSIERIFTDAESNAAYGCECNDSIDMLEGGWANFFNLSATDRQALSMFLGQMANLPGLLDGFTDVSFVKAFLKNHPNLGKIAGVLPIIDLVINGAERGLDIGNLFRNPLDEIPKWLEFGGEELIGYGAEGLLAYVTGGISEIAFFANDLNQFAGNIYSASTLEILNHMDPNAPGFDNIKDSLAEFNKFVENVDLNKPFDSFKALLNDVALEPYANKLMRLADNPTESEILDMRISTMLTTAIPVLGMSYNLVSEMFINPEYGNEIMRDALDLGGHTVDFISNAPALMGAYNEHTMRLYIGQGENLISQLPIADSTKQTLLGYTDFFDKAVDYTGGGNIFSLPAIIHETGNEFFGDFDFSRDVTDKIKDRFFPLKT